MKKSIIALAVAGALAAPMVAQADATLYGSLRLKAQKVDGAGTDIADNVSRIGIKGSVDTNIDGVKAIYQGEWKVDTADSGDFGAGRLAYVGLTGGFGTAAIGRQWVPHYSWVTSTVDIMDGNNTGVTSPVVRSGNMVTYVSPAMGGFQAAAGVIADDASPTAEEGNGADGHNILAKYNIAGVTLAASRLNLNSDEDKVIANGLSVAYSSGPAYLAAVAQRWTADFEGMDKESVNLYEVAGSYAFGDTKLLANFAKLEDAKLYGVEVQQTLGKQVRAFVNYTSANNEAEDLALAFAPGKEFDAGTTAFKDSVSLGMRVDF